MAKKVQSATSKLKSKSGNPPLIRVLIVEDSEADALLIIRELKKNGYSPVSERVETAAAMRRALQDKTWDIVLSECKMLHFSGTDAIALLRETNMDIPLIIVSGSIGEEMAVECMRLGAQDFIMRDSLPRLCPAITRELEEADSRRKRRQAEEALHQSEAKYRKILESIADGYFEVDLAGNFTFFNESTCLLLGYAPEEMMGMNNRQFTDAESAKKLFQAFHEVYKTGNPIKEFAWQVTRKDGTKRFAESSISLQKDSAGKPIGFRGVAHDVTERKLAEQAVLASEFRFRELFENMSNCVAVYEATADGSDFILKDFNRAAALTEKIDAKTAIGQSLLQIFPGVRDMGLLEVLQRVWRTAQAEHVPAIYYKDKRVEGWRENYVYKLPTGEVIALYNDITERKKAERKIFESEGKYRLLVENSSEAIFIAQDAMLQFANRASLTLFDSTYEVLTSTPFAEFIHPEDREMVIGSYLRRLRGEKVSLVYAFRIVTAGGIVKWVEINATVISWQGKPATLNFLTEITSRRQAEEALQETQKLLQDAYRLAEIGSFRWNFSDKTIIWSEELYQMTGQKFLKTGFPEIQHPRIYTPGSWDLLQKSINDSLQTGKPFQVELEIVHPDGSNRWLNWIGSAIRDRSGKITGMHGTAQNITQRKIAQSQREAALEALRESEEKYRWVLDNMADVLAVMDMNLHFTYVSPAVLHMRGYTAEEAMAQTMEEVLTPESMQSMANVFAEELKLEASGTADPGRSRILEVEGYKKDGSIVWMENHLSFLRDETNKAIGIISLARDITVLKKAEEQLKQSEKRYRSIFENAQEGIYRSTPDGRIVIANQAMADMLGYKTPEELLTSVTDMSLQLYVHPAERAKIEKIIEEQGSARNYETQFYRKDGSVIWVSLTMHADCDEKGQIIHYDCINDDITKQKQVVEQIRKALGATVQAITVTVETRDPYTAGHQRRVSDLARAIATQMNMPSDQIEGIRMAAAIHDLGKISVPAEILSKPTKLTNIEFSLIKNHPQSGHDILKDIDFPWPVARIVLEHHERMDGSGYPNGLIGDDILLEARILAVADVVESMSSHRPYRPALGMEAALDEIEKNKGIFYDDTVVEACLRLFRDKGFQLGKTGV
jgi:PAS domain S-box-containing protein